MEGIHILCTLVHSHEACAFRILVKALHFYDYHQDDVIFILWDQQFHSNKCTSDEHEGGKLNITCSIAG